MIYGAIALGRWLFNIWGVPFFRLGFEATLSLAADNLRNNIDAAFRRKSNFVSVTNSRDEAMQFHEYVTLRNLWSKGTGFDRRLEAKAKSLSSEEFRRHILDTFPNEVQASKQRR